MARCLNPRTIKNLSPFRGTRHGVYVAASRYARDNIVRRSYDEIVVPCGKCLNCLKNRQSSMVVRCKREAQFRGSFAFMTLTYDDDHLPLARSLFRASKETGEMEVFYKPEFISSGVNPDPYYCDLFKGIAASPNPRYFEYPFPVPDDEFEYFVRITPSVCRSDVRTWLKMARIQWKRDHGESLPDFSYVAISEYGPRTCRPHYHLAFFGLQRKHLDYLLNRWSYGKVKQVKMVSAVNGDKSDGYLKASRYIGKYMSKGKFECDSVAECAAERPRVCQSMHLGTKELEPIRRQVLCFDMFGEYDPETLEFHDGKPLSRLQVDALVREIPRRLCYTIGHKKDGDPIYLPLPRIVRDKIFKTVQDEDDPKKKVSSALWCMVTASIRDDADRDRDERFREFCSLHPEREASENCLAFAEYQAFCAGVEEAVVQENYRSFYSKSHF